MGTLVGVLVRRGVAVAGALVGVSVAVSEPGGVGVEVAAGIEVGKTTAGRIEYLVPKSEILNPVPLG